ncbi:head-tail adaptor Ad2 [Vibrio phage D479]
MQMYSASSPKELKDLILRRLGAPVINIEVTEDQVYDCVSRAIELFIDYHPDGLRKTFSVIRLTEEQAASGIIQLDLPAHSVTSLLRSGSTFWTMDGNATYTWFNDFLQGLTGNSSGCNSYYPGMLGQGDLSSYWQLMSYKNTMMDMLQPVHDYFFDATNNMVRINGNLITDEYIILECYVPTAMLVQESGTGIVGNRAATVGSLESVTDANAWDDPYSALKMGNFVGNPELYAPQGVYNIRWVKDMATAFVKQVNGTILKKHQGMQLPGGTTVDGQTIYQEATEEIAMLREELMNLITPLPILYG